MPSRPILRSQFASLVLPTRARGWIMVGYTVRQEQQQYCNGMHALWFRGSLFVKAFVDGTKPLLPHLYCRDEDFWDVTTIDQVPLGWRFQFFGGNSSNNSLVSCYFPPLMPLGFSSRMLYPARLVSQPQVSSQNFLKSKTRRALPASHFVLRFAGNFAPSPPTEPSFSRLRSILQQLSAVCSALGLSLHSVPRSCNSQIADDTNTSPIPRFYMSWLGVYITEHPVAKSCAWLNTGKV